MITIFTCPRCHRTWRRSYATAPTRRQLRQDSLCEPCGLHAQATPIRGHTTNATCGAACRQATTAVCRCECGGQNHGAAYDPQNSQARPNAA